ncbi:hypothetical protein [Rufibacter roseus]|uniref:Uncharacterized protein n=1 Tax=Rufibacter roseus TaxID=1567108 RepID=A0ABW2DFJ3_9BACT
MEIAVMAGLFTKRDMKINSGQNALSKGIALKEKVRLLKIERQAVNYKQ